MNKDTALPPWIIFLLIALGVALAVGVALLLTQLDALQQRTLLPLATLPVINVEATLSAGDLTVVVIAGEDVSTSTPPLTPSLAAETPEQITVEPTPAPVLVPTCAAAPDGWVPYDIQEGDTLATLSIQLGVETEMLLQANCLTQAQLIPGQVIFVPFLLPTEAAEEHCDVPNEWVQYVVEPGDTLASLAGDNNVDIALLMLANCLVEIEIVPGRTIFLPPMSAQRPILPSRTTAPPAVSTPPIRRPGMMPTAEPPVWPTKLPWPKATPRPIQSPAATPIAFVTTSPTETAMPRPANASDTPIPTSTSGFPYPAVVPISTATISVSATSSATATLTPTAKATVTITLTATATETMTPTTPAMEIITPTATATETITPSPTATATFTVTPSPTASYTPSPTAAVSDTPSPAASLTPSPSATASTTGWPSPMGTNTPPAYPYP